MKYILHSLLVSVLALNGCSTNDGGSIDDDGSISGIEGTGDIAITASITSGTVTGFGSVYVNGIHFNTDDAIVKIDGVVVDEQTLDIGMVVSIEGETDKETNEHTALHITANSLIKGKVNRVEHLNLTLKTLDILGQTVFVTEDTTFKDVGFEELEEGMTLHINGFSNNDGTVAATHVTRTTSSTGENSDEIEGKITSVNAEGDVSLNDFAIDYSEATFEGGSFADLLQETRIEIIGEANYSINTMKASVVRFKKSRMRKPGEHTTIEGLATDIIDGSHFYIDDTKIDTNAVASNSKDLTNGSRVIVKGDFENGVLTAKSIYIKQQTFDQFSGPLETIDPKANELSILGTTIKVNEFTAYEDRGSMSNRYIDIEDLRTDDDLVIFASLINDEWVASRIRRQASSDQYQSLRGRVTAIVNSTQFYVVGVLVNAEDVDAEDLEDIQIGSEVSFKGNHLGFRDFKAESITVYQTRDCDRRVFFRCSERSLLNGKSFSKGFH